MPRQSTEESRLLEAFIELDNLLVGDRWKKPTAKSSAKSTKARREGNELYTSMKLHDERSHVEMLRLYTRSAAYAPPGSEELGLAYGNRSALLAHLGKYEEAVEDLDRAQRMPVSDLQVVKYLCRKVECQVELGLEEARYTSEKTKTLLEEIKASDQIKKDIIIKLGKAIDKLEKQEFKLPEIKNEFKLPDGDKFDRHRSSENPDASDALTICHNTKLYRFGRHIITNRDIAPGEVLYAGAPYVCFPMESRQHSNCWHCLRFCWAGLPCEHCVHAVYCSLECRIEAWRLYHEAECRVVCRASKVIERMNSARLMSVRMLLMALREAGDLRKLRESCEEIDAWEDPRTRGFSNEHTTFENDHRAAYSLLNLSRKTSDAQLITISTDSAVLVHHLAKHTKLFQRYFEYESKALAKSEDALFVGQLLSHYQHVLLINGVTVKDAYPTSSTDWSWSSPQEENCTGLYLTPYLGLINHSCCPNVALCHMEDRRTVLYALRPIAKGEQVFVSYGPTYAELPKPQRQNHLLERFHFECRCEACEGNWQMFTKMVTSGVSFTTLNVLQIEETLNAQEKSEKILQAMQEGNCKYSIDTLRDCAYAVVLHLKFCRMPNWRLPSLVDTLIAVFNALYGYVVDVPNKC